MRPERMAKFAVHYEAFKMIKNVPGSIVECGVFKGTSFVRFAMLRELFENNYSAKLVGFDVFSDKFPDTKFKQDKKQREHWINTAGGSSISKDQLSKILDDKDIKNYELIDGDVADTIPKYVKKNPGMKISLLNIDIDFVEPTICVLENFYDKVMPGGIILLDNYGGEGDSGISLHGDTKGVDEFIKGKNIKILRFPFASRPCYIIK